MILMSSQICSMLISDIYNGFYKCTTCDKHKKGNGYTNLLNHLRRNHDNYEQEALEVTLQQRSLIPPARTSAEDEKHKDGTVTCRRSPGEEEGQWQLSDLSGKVEEGQEPDCEADDAEDCYSRESYVFDSMPSDFEDSGTQPYETVLTPTPNVTRSMVFLKTRLSVEGASGAAVVARGASLGQQGDEPHSWWWHWW
ncbi:hypothetical protein PF004_g5724 [Phytophthora fragariae]|uniref:BED-type domain-containing protein n=1 Tax=Phytophthora fragariae TaxID=53985 RepID=A0A6G0PF42_9STRA|nr:hypothetical protein PF004_g5724 [Phytophthora fragariae]